MYASTSRRKADPQAIWIKPRYGFRIAVGRQTLYPTASLNLLIAWMCPSGEPRPAPIVFTDT